MQSQGQRQVALYVWMGSNCSWWEHTAQCEDDKVLGWVGYEFTSTSCGWFLHKYIC